MKKFLLGILVGIILVGLALFIFVFAAMKFAAPKRPSVAANSVLTVKLDGDVPEMAPVQIAVPWIESQTPPSLRDIWVALRHAATDKRVKAIVLEPSRLGVGWAKLQELHHQIAEFKKSGKPVYAYLKSPGTKEYYLATVADQIYLAEEDYLDVKGLRLESVYLKNTFDKLGIQFEVDHIGKYKDAGDVLTRNNMSPETREVLNQLLDQLYGDFCATVGAGRKKNAEEVRSLVDRGPFLAKQAKQNGLVDVLAYEDQIYGDVSRKAGKGDLTRINLKSYIRASSLSEGSRIALLVGQGEIMRGTNESPFGEQDGIASESIIKTIRQVRDDANVKGVIFRVNSPGGDAIASDDILHEMKILSQRKPLVISMSDLAASGGYYIAMTGDPVVAYPNTITGSIGVLYGKPNLRGLYDKLGIKKEILSRGKLAEIDSDYAGLSEEGRQKLRESLQSVYTGFISRVAASRKRSAAQIEPLAQGRVWMGAQAKQNGLVDEVGGLDKAVELVKQRAKIPAGASISLVPYPPRKNFLEILTSSPVDSLIDSTAEAKLEKIIGFRPPRSLLQGGLLRLMPYQIDVH